MSEQDSCSSKSKLEWISDHGGDGQTSGVYNAETQVSSGFPDWDSGDWEESTDGGESERIISVRLGERTKRISIDGSSEAIRDAIQSAFGLKTWQDFWLEDESEIVRPLDRDMPLSAYTLHLTERWLIKYCPSDDLKHTKCKTLEKDFYSQYDFSYFLLSHGWVGLKEPGDNKIVDMIDDLKSDVLYHGLDQ